MCMASAKQMGVDQALPVGRREAAPVIFQAAGFEAGKTKLALHPASEENPAGSVQLGLGSEDVDRFHEEAQAKGITFTSPPADMHGTRASPASSIRMAPRLG